jgi:allantoinase
VPYTLEANDMRFSGTGLNTGEQFYSYLKDAFDVLYAEGAERPKMMSWACTAGSPAAGKMAGLERFIRYALAHRTSGSAAGRDRPHWRERHPMRLAS